jgi:type VI secretion system protein ImpC
MAAKKQMEVQEVVQLEGPDLLDEIMSTGIKAKGDAQKERGQELIKTLVAELVDPSIVVAKNSVKTINARIAAIDELLSRQVDEIMHAKEFQKLEGSWRSLHKLVMGTETGEMLKLRVLNVSKKDLLRDFQSAAEFTESALWKQIYENEFGTFGGDPYGALVGDYEFGKGAQDVELLSQMSAVAAASHAPFISATGPEMFGMESFTQMPDPRDLAKIFDNNNP